MSVEVPSAPKSQLRRIAGLDGLRGVAVILVLIYHLMPAYMPGGFIGVDIFFVLSGFLITALLMSDMDRFSRLRLKRFWHRRARRVLPAAITAILITSAIAVFVIRHGPHGEEQRDILFGIRRQLAGSLTFTYNWTEIWNGTNYFTRNAPTLLTNVWSLAVEEQFYIFWPLILFLLMKFKKWLKLDKHVIAAFIFLLAIGSATLMWRFGGLDINRAYMGTDTHAFGLLLGASMAVFLPGVLSSNRVDEANKFKKSVSGANTKIARGILAWLSLCGICLLALVLDSENPKVFPYIYPGGLLVASLLGLIIIWTLSHVNDSSAPGSLIEQSLKILLDCPPLRWLGERSYGLYLWHWPLVVILFYAFPELSIEVAAAAVLVLTVVLAEISYRLIEHPIRTRGFRSYLRTSFTTGVWRSSLSFMLCIGIACLVSLAYWKQPQVTSAQGSMNVTYSQSPMSGNNFTQSGQSDAPIPSSADTAQSANTHHADKKSGPIYSSLSQDGHTPSVNGSQITLVGDSVALNSQAVLLESFPGMAINAAVSRSFFQAIPVLDELDSSFGIRPYVIIALATNGTVSGDQLNELINHLGPNRHLVLVTGFGPPRASWIPGANDEVRQIARAHPDRIHVADWSEAIANHTDLLAQDLIHPVSDDARKIYTSLISDALDGFNQ